MSNRFGRTLVLAAALLGVVVIAPACRHTDETPVPTEGVENVVIQEELETIQDVTIEPGSVSAETEQKALTSEVTKSPTTAMRWKKIPPVTVPRGGGVRFKAEIDTAWIVIPDGKIRKYSGGKDWAKGKSFIAFKVAEGEAVVMVPRDYRESPTPIEIYYSVLAQNAGGEWEYVHGDNPPPRMIIPPRN